MLGHTLTAVTNFSLSGQNNVDSLLWGTKWGGTLGSGIGLTYSFSDLSTLWDSPYGALVEPLNGFEALAANEQTAVTSALLAWSNVANITFAEVFDDDVSSLNGDIRFSAYDASLIGRIEAAHAYFPDTSSSAGDVWLNRDLDFSLPSNVSPGSFNFFTLLHEI
jgi:hypothetical protein